MTVSDWSTLRKLMWLRDSTGRGGSPLTVTGATPLLMPGALAKPLKKATFSIEPVQSGSGDPSPNNVRPIYGSQGAKIWVTGKNFANMIEDGKVPSTTTGQLVPANGCRTDYIRVTPGATYTISAETASNNYVYWFNYTADKQFINYGNTQQGTSVVLTINAHSNAAYIMLRTTVGLAGITSLQFEPGSTATPYTPYSGSTVSVTFPESVGTVYGGTFDPVTGEGVVTHDALVFDNGVWSFTSDFFYRNVIASGQNVSGYYTTENGVKMYLNGNNGQARIYLGDNSFLTSETDVGELLDGMKLLYPLATPIPFTLTPQTLIPPAGDAYIWADCGSTAEVTYIGKP